MLPCSVMEALQKADRKQMQLAGIGCFAQVFKIADTGFIIKKALDHPVVGNLQPTEKRIYERLGHHPCILQYYGEYCERDSLPNGLVFQYQIAGTLMENLALSHYPKRTRWPLQAAEALRFIHSKNVIHNDFGSHNFLIQEDGSLVLVDFGGSQIDDTSPVVSYSTRYARPGADGVVSNETDDLFALGTIIYEISVGNLLYTDRSSRKFGKYCISMNFRI
ncbi:hypothetical protein N7540_012226 [Penicillium herquei]|nr:hypothetical protein N7540_012226 [Penicillium herquei]